MPVTVGGPEVRTSAGSWRRTACAASSSLVGTLVSTSTSGVGRAALRRSQDLASLDVVLVDPTQPRTDVVAGLASGQRLRNISTPVRTRAGVLGAHGLCRCSLRRAHPARCDRCHGLDGDGEHVLDRHQERLVGVRVRTCGCRCRPAPSIDDPWAWRRRLDPRGRLREPHGATGMSSPGNWYSLRSRGPPSRPLRAALFRRPRRTRLFTTTMDGTPTWRASSTCSGSGACGGRRRRRRGSLPSTSAAPVIMLLM